MSKQIDRETYDKVKAMLADPIPMVDADETAKYLLRMLGHEPPEHSPFPDISPGDWRPKPENDDTFWVYDVDARSVCMVSGGKHHEANKGVILAAPDLMKELHAVYTDSTDKAAIGAVLRKAGVNV